MSDARAGPPQPEPTERPAPAPAADATAPGEEDALLGGEAPATDDAPTVITRNPPRGAPPGGDPAALRGRRLAHFELIEPIGAGGMATVLRARDTLLDRDVALKILPPEMAADPENVRRFHQEARSAARLDHENIARVFFCGEDQGLHFIAFEFVEGEDLRALLQRRGPLPAAEAIHYVLQAAAGLAHAAARGVVHRDIKPSNILVETGGRAKLVDMGLARSLERHDAGLTQSGVTLGTFDYISPEQALEPRDADVRSDLYSLGCTFYHLLTGRPPVPEGTAAKKLHHHQHVRPVDPRELAPGLPDEVVLILDRMLAKQPRHRYQSPEELIHHLVLAARHLGADEEVPAGVVPVETPLAAPPGGRPLVMAAAAALAVVGLVVVLGRGGLTPGPAPAGRGGASAGGSAAGAAAPPSLPAGADTAAPRKPDERRAAEATPAPVPARYGADRPTVKDLAEWAAKQPPGRPLVIELADDVEFQVGPGGENPGLVLRAPRVEIRPKGSRRPTVRLSNPQAIAQKEAWAAITVEGDLIAEGLRFVLDASGADVDMAGLSLRGARREYRVRGCEFVQVGPQFSAKHRLASVFVDGQRGAAAPLLKLEECCFLGCQQLDEVREGPDPSRPRVLEPGKTERGGLDAVVRRGPVRVDAVNCAFGPHAAAFRLAGGGEAAEAPVALRHCTVLEAAGSAAFQADADAEAALDVRACLFSRPGAGGGLAGMGEEDAKAVLVRQAAGRGAVTYRGSDNRYHNLDAYWAVGETAEAGDWKDFQAKLEKEGGVDRGSAPLEVSPWKDPSPLALLRQPEPARAFHPDEQDAELRVAGGAALAGVEKLGAVSFGASPAGGQTLKVVPGVKESAKGVYPSLREAVTAARPGDTVVICANGPVPVGPLTLDERATDLTVKAADDYRPVLTLAATDKAEPALFALHDGRLRLEDLEIRLEPQRAFDSLAVVALVGDGQCELARCRVTLAREHRPTAMAVAVLPDASGAPRMMDTGDRPPRAKEQGPLLVVRECFVRGDGDLVRSPAGRPLELRALNAAVVLTGSFVDAAGAGDAPGAGAGPQLQADLERVTAYLDGHLFRLRAGEGLKGLLPVACRAAGCLFVAGSDRSLIHLDGAAADVEQLKARVRWSGEHNAYANFKRRPMLDQQPADGAAAPAVADGDWRSFADEKDARFAEVTFRPPMPPAEGFKAVTPAQAKPADLPGFGADLPPGPG
jgi:hypothetical protein